MDHPLLQRPAEHPGAGRDGGGQPRFLHRRPRQQCVQHGGHRGLPLIGAAVQRGGKLAPLGGEPELQPLVLRRGGGGAPPAQRQRQRGAQQLDGGSAHGPSSSRSAGNSASNRVPRPAGLGPAVISPPWRRAVSRAMESPRPVPPAARERALSTR